MGEDEDYIEEEQASEKSSSRLKKLFSFGFFERLGGELLRFIIFAIVAFFIAQLVLTWNKDSKLAPIAGELGDINAAGNIITRPLGVEWPMEEMIINTADNLDSHFVKARIVISCVAEDPALIAELEQRSGEVHAEVREIIGTKNYLALKQIEQQRILTQEIKTRVQRVVGHSGIIDVFLKEFSVH